MILDRNVYLQDNTITYDTEGISIQTWTASQTLIRVNRQTGRNTRDNMDYNKFGLSDSSIVEIFFSKPNINILEAKRILDGTEGFIIVHVRKYNTHYEIVTNPDIKAV